MRVDGGGRTADPQEKDLADFLQAQPALRGRVHLVAEQQRPSGMTQSVATVLADLGPAAMTALGTALVTWLRHRTSNTRITLRRPDGTRVELTAQRVRGLAAAEVSQLVAQLTDALDDRA